MSSRKTLLQFVTEASKKHNSKYDYSLVNYINAFTKVTIICPIHGVFLQTPHNHTASRKGETPRGCPLCANLIRAEKTKKQKSYNIEKFIKLAQEVHGDQYDYTNSVYNGMFCTINIRCRIHSEFTQAARAHTAGSGCPKCGLGNNSKLETQWLDSLGILPEHRQYCITIGTKRFFVDGYDPLTNTVYEFYGDFWHGNPKKYNQNNINSFLGKTFGELYQSTCIREEILIKLGYSIKSVWESDFKDALKLK